MNRKTWAILVLAAGVLAAGAAADNLDYWLDRAQPVASSPAAGSPAEPQPVSAPADENAAAADGLPGAVELSDGTILGGTIVTTRDQPWEVYVAAEKRWRRLPPLAVLGVVAVVDEEGMEDEWRWAGMGTPQRVYTGRQYPFRRFRWTFRLIDGSEVTGTVKGQPFRIICGGRRCGPYVLHERDKGPPGTTLEQLVYVKHLVISRRAMVEAASGPAPGGL